MFEIAFSGANIQRFNLDDRIVQIRQGITGFVFKYTDNASAWHRKGRRRGKSCHRATTDPSTHTNQPLGVWANGWGDFVNIDDSGFAKGYRFTTGGVSVGIDYRLTDHLAVGLLGAYAHTWTDFRPGDGDVDTGRGGLYATYFDHGWWVNSGVWGGYNS
jgi:outer membrane autotransporter protein